MTSLFSTPLTSVESKNFTYFCRECGHVIDRAELVAFITTMDLDVNSNPKYKFRVGHPANDTVACQTGQYTYLETGSVGQGIIDANHYIHNRFVPVGYLDWEQDEIININAAVDETHEIDLNMRKIGIQFQNNGVDTTCNLPDILDIDEWR